MTTQEHSAIPMDLIVARSAGDLGRTSTAPVELRVIRTADEWDTLEEAWESLFATSPTASPPLQFHWMREWWRIYGPIYGEGGLRILSFWRGTRLVGVLPLYEQAFGPKWLACKRLRFLSTGEQSFEETCPDYLDLLHAPGEAAECLEAIERLLRDRRQLGWDELDLCDISEHSPLIALARAPESRLHLAARGTCLVADLSEGFEAYLARLSAKTRERGRQDMRAVTRAGGQFVVASNADEARRIFDQLVALHQARWAVVGQSGCFAAPRFVELHRSLCELLVPSGKAILASICVGDAPLAAVYGFVTGDKFDHYQSGTTVDGPRAVHSPGTAVLLLLMQFLAERGLRTFDFLGGTHDYKKKLATDQRKLARLQGERLSLRLRGHYASDLARRGLGHAWHRLSSRVRTAAVMRRGAASSSKGGGPNPPTNIE
jgi:CelD/BcsL family acetyltransferase involved in cellulose biosynthesis